MLLLISDANILIDIEIGGLVAPMFSLEYQFAVPDILFYEELEEQHAHLIDMGLQPKDLDEAMVARVSELVTQYPRPGRNDLFALVLAAKEECPLLTGPKRNRKPHEFRNHGRKRSRRTKTVESHFPRRLRDHGSLTQAWRVSSIRAGWGRRCSLSCQAG